jgi:hypothetical protein
MERSADDVGRDGSGDTNPDWDKRGVRIARFGPEMATPACKRVCQLFDTTCRELKRLES